MEVQSSPTNSTHSSRPRLEHALQSRHNRRVSSPACLKVLHQKGSMKINVYLVNNASPTIAPHAKKYRGRLSALKKKNQLKIIKQTIKPSYRARREIHTAPGCNDNNNAATKPGSTLPVNSRMSKNMAYTLNTPTNTKGKRKAHTLSPSTREKTNWSAKPNGGWS